MVASKTALLLLKQSFQRKGFSIVSKFLLNSSNVESVLLRIDNTVIPLKGSTKILLRR